MLFQEIRRILKSDNLNHLSQDQKVILARILNDDNIINVLRHDMENAAKSALILEMDRFPGIFRSIQEICKKHGIAI